MGARKNREGEREGEMEAERRNMWEKVTERTRAQLEGGTGRARDKQAKD